MAKEDHSDFWENIYLNDDVGWDLKGVTPIFDSLSDELVKGSVCIVGCGRGHDAIMFAQKGFDVTAIDFAPSAIHFVKKLAKAANVGVNTVQDDIFTLHNSFSNSFDYIIEQTCFCAIHPSRRVEYVSVMKKILKPGGMLIGLWFPLDKQLDEGGPPWGQNIREVKGYFKSGWEIIREEFSELSIKPREGREKLIIFKRL